MVVKTGFAVLTALIVGLMGIRPTMAQSGVECPPPLITVNAHLEAPRGVKMPIYAEPSFDSQVRGFLTTGVGVLAHEFNNPEITCIDGTIWWFVEAYEMWGEQLDYSVPRGWVPERIAGEPVVRFYIFMPTAPLGGFESVQGIPPVITTVEAPLPTLAPSGLPTDLSGAFAQSDSVMDAVNALVLPEAYAGNVYPDTLPIDLNRVYFVADAGLSPEGLAILAQNGFVVTPSPEVYFERAYLGRSYLYDDVWDMSQGYGHFITTDALYQAFFLLYKNMQQVIEREHLASQVYYSLLGAYLNAIRQYEAARGTELEAAARSALVYYLVPLRVLTKPISPETSMNDVTSRLADLPDADAIAAEADALFSLILAAQGREPIPFLNDYIEDFSQYQLRGYYRGSDVLERYFQAMMWLGRITFRLDKPQETTAGLLVMRAMSQASIDGGDFGTYQQVMDTLGFLIGPVDDYTVADYLPVARAAFGDDLELMAFADADRMAAFVADAQRLPPPRINSIALEVEPLTVEEMQDETRGFRLFGQRFTFDGYLMQSLIYPAVGTVDQSRTLPLGLDVVATLGSDRAYALADAEGATDFANYTDAMSRLREEVAVLSDSDWLQNVAGGWLWMLQPLANPDRALLPPMLRTDAWQHKNITATLGSWTQLKYATLLYAERPSGGLGGGGFRPPLTSYSMIEPNPSAFVRLGVLSGLVHQALIDRQYYMSSDGFRQLPLGNIMFGFSLLSDIALELAAIGIRQMTPEGATYDDYYYLQYRFGYHLDLVRYSATVDDPMPEPDTALIADVANNAAAGTVLHAAIGTPDYIYVVTRTPFGLALARGTVYSYYEFVSPIDERLNNDTWREMLIQNPPPRPSWMDLYFVD